MLVEKEAKVKCTYDRNTDPFLLFLWRVGLGGGKVLSKN